MTDQVYVLLCEEELVGLRRNRSPVFRRSLSSATQEPDSDG